MTRRFPTGIVRPDVLETHFLAGVPTVRRIRVRASNVPGRLLALSLEPAAPTVVEEDVRRDEARPWVLLGATAVLALGLVARAQRDGGRRGAPPPPSRRSVRRDGTFRADPARRFRASVHTRRRRPDRFRGPPPAALDPGVGSRGRERCGLGSGDESGGGSRCRSRRLRTGFSGALRRAFGALAPARAGPVHRSARGAARLGGAGGRVERLPGAVGSAGGEGGSGEPDGARAGRRGNGAHGVVVFRRSVRDDDGPSRPRERASRGEPVGEGLHVPDVGPPLAGGRRRASRGGRGLRSRGRSFAGAGRRHRRAPRKGRLAVEP